MSQKMIFLISIDNWFVSDICTCDCMIALLYFAVRSKSELLLTPGPLSPVCCGRVYHTHRPRNL